jgi:hypothetical protein
MLKLAEYANWRASPHVWMDGRYRPLVDVSSAV